MAQSYKVCPICDTPNHRNASVCLTCGATLANVKTASPGNGNSGKKPSGYNFHYGEADLSEGTVRWKGGTYILAGLLALSALVCVGAAAFAGARLFTLAQPTATLAPGTPVPAGQPAAIITNTPRPTVFLETVTPAPPTTTLSPTPTITPTEGPCVQVVLPNDDLYAIIARCGHVHYDVMLSVVAELNGLDDPSRILPNQEILVPWPTPTTDPNAPPSPEATTEANAGGAGVAAASTEPARVGGLAPRPTETLLPGVMWHQVQPDENILAISFQYGANLKVLSELNPEVRFSQCDFGSASGGPTCIVELFIGQQIRVPAPTPTPTLSPTPSGSETPTPSPTATFNAPTPLSPSDRAFFRADEIVTLRWVTSGTLAANQVYAVRVEDRTASISYSATTRELYFIVPEQWHNQDSARHDFVWTVSVVDNERPNDPYFTTEPRLFTWQGRGKGGN